MTLLKAFDTNPPNWVATEFNRKINEMVSKGMVFELTPTFAKV